MAKGKAFSGRYAEVCCSFQCCGLATLILALCLLLIAIAVPWYTYTEAYDAESGSNPKVKGASSFTLFWSGIISDVDLKITSDGQTISKTKKTKTYDWDDSEEAAEVFHAAMSFAVIAFVFTALVVVAVGIANVYQARTHRRYHLGLKIGLIVATCALIVVTIISWAVFIGINDALDQDHKYCPKDPINGKPLWCTKFIGGKERDYNDPIQGKGKIIQLAFPSIGWWATLISTLFLFTSLVMFIFIRHRHAEHEYEEIGETI